MKLLRREARHGLDKDKDRQFACISRRLPIDFYSNTAMIQGAEEKQVEGHLRVCLGIDHERTGMKTVAPSEPLLSEAAARLLYRAKLDLPSPLLNVLSSFSIDQGDRGEFIVMQLLNDARDMSVYPESPEDLISIYTPLTFSLLTFFENLFWRDIAKDTPSKAHPMHAGKTFETLFANATMNFNHFIKVHEYDAIETKYLLALTARAVAILCAANQKGVDGVNPFLFFDQRLSRWNLAVFLWQSKNDPSYTFTPQPELFHTMDPFALGVLPRLTGNEAPIPIIRVVFALAAKSKPSLTLMKYDEETSEQFTTFDYWCAGISSEVLKPVTDDTQKSWDSLLQASYPWKQIYAQALKGASRELRRAQNPGAAADPGHYKCWWKFHE